MEQKHIVVVEDDPGLSGALRDAFSAQNVMVTIVSRGDEATKTIMDVRPDLVLLDFMLPGTTGEYILQELAQEEPTQDIPVIIVTNFEEIGSLEQDAQVRDNLVYLVKANTSLSDIVQEARKLMTA